MMKFVRSAALAAFALVAVLAVGTTPSYAAVDDKGQLTAKIDDSDKVTKKEVVATPAPTVGTPSVPVTVTTHYLHKTWFWQNNQVYHIKTSGTAEYVQRLDYWMHRDSDGKLYRFNKGSGNGIETARPTVDIGARDTMISTGDRSQVNGVSAGAVSADGSTRGVNISYRYWHAENYNDVTYTVASSTSAKYVAEQNAHMVWIGSTLYKVNSAGQVQSLSERPTANVGAKDKRISASDEKVTRDPTVTAGATSRNARTRELTVTNDYVHVEEYQKLRYSLQHEETATFVAEQNAHMAWISNKLYRVRVGTDSVQLLSSKPVVRLGDRLFKVDFSDPLSSVEVTPASLTSDSKSIVVNVYRHYTHTETFQVKEYYLSSTEIARYNESYRVWTVIVDGRIYAIAFDGDSVSNSGDVIVIKAPGGMKRPDVIVVNPGGNPTDPPVVVPGKKNPDNTDPPVVVPGKKKPADTDPPVVVPGKKRPPVIVTDGDDDGPAVVVPRR